MNHRRQVFGLLGWLGLTLAAAALGARASIEAAAFYGQLALPGWAPPASVFGPVWTALYLMMAISAWLVWRRGGWRSHRATLGLYVTQLVVNVLWSWLFFAWKLGAAAFVDILLLLVLIVATMLAFARRTPLAAWLLLPYLAWVSFASALCYTVWQLNPAVL
ncbi:TspO/MBR family protein [Stenotrophomonas sp.]|uniref:TspO/MBR family protein n=1 Tax=Stenotrophomonas sp. TaxID=69392 RepID=UPI002D671D79|nr:TspO/MBR family protein [Stenotrophomonas sp.]HYQ21964.1 TspO/MBR family protein [Stenotrophomonas sp.]